MKQVVRKKINKKRYLYLLLVSYPLDLYTVDGLYTLRSAHEEGFTQRLPQPLPLYINFNFKVKLIELII